MIALEQRVDKIDSEIKELIACNRSLADISKINSERIKALEELAQEFKDVVKNTNRLFSFGGKIAVGILVTLIVNAIKAFI